MAASYFLDVVCTNCESEERHMEIPFGQAVSEVLCKICGCFTLIKIRSPKEENKNEKS